LEGDAPSSPCARSVAASDGRRFRDATAATEHGPPAELDPES